MRKFLGLSGMAIFSLVLYIILAIMRPFPALALTFPQDFSYSNRNEVLLDRGELWELNSIFHPLDIIPQDTTENTSKPQQAPFWIKSYLNDYSKISFRSWKALSDNLSMILIPGMGTSMQNGIGRDYDKIAPLIYIWFEARLGQKWYIRFYDRTTSQAASLSHYSGVSRKLDRAGFNTGEIDKSLIGFQNNYIRAEYGRSREIWGPMVEENVMLAGRSPSYERLMLQVNHRSFSYRWFYGYLESVQDIENIQRFIVGRALEYRNRKNFVIGVGEVSVVAGPDRGIEFHYLNPLAFHVEIEQNNRTGQSGNYENAIWFLHVDWLTFRSLRLSGSLIIDEFTIDSKPRQEGRPHALGWLGRVAWTLDTGLIDVTFISEYVRVDTYTMQHTRKYSGFVTRNQLLGHPIGNDADRIEFGVRIMPELPILLEVELGQLRWGDNSLLFDPYSVFIDLYNVPFPSGEARTNQYLKLKLDTEPLRGISLNIESHLDLKNSGSDSALEVITVRATYKIPLLLRKD